MNENTPAVECDVTVQEGSVEVVATSDLPAVEIFYDGGRLEAIRESARRLLKEMVTKDECHCIWGLPESIWPSRLLSEFRDMELKKASLVLVPLSRIGQMEGKSGSLVLIGYFADGSKNGIPPSHPVIVKTIPKENGAKLKREFQQGENLKPFAYDQKDVFAIPFRMDEQNSSFCVLWSIFSASEPLWADDDDDKKLAVRDLRNLIIEEQDSVVKEVLNESYSTLRRLHQPFGRVIHETRRIGEEYEWHQREFGEKWGPEWIQFWAEADQQVINVDGREWTNPIWILRQLQDRDVLLTMGAVHGDLHPGNIVLSESNRPRIIDFGWSQERAHIAKDFVLMECNLRFLMLRPQLSIQDVTTFTQWIEWDAPLPSDLSDYCRQRVELILHLRESAKITFPEDTDWDWEYLVPLFLVAFGLLRFAPQLGNQFAAMQTVLALASHVGQLLDDN